MSEMSWSPDDRLIRRLKDSRIAVARILDTGAYDGLDEVVGWVVDDLDAIETEMNDAIRRSSAGRDEGEPPEILVARNA